MPWLFDLPMLGSLAKGWIAWDRGCRGTWKVSDYTEGVTIFPKRLCSREGKAKDGFVLVIRISIWNQMHNRSASWNNESVNFH